MLSIEEGYCRCGCGQRVTYYNKAFRKYRPGHYPRDDKFKNTWRNKDRKIKQLTSKGYYIIYSPDHPYKNANEFVFQHRLIMEHYLKIMTDEDIYLKPNVDDVIHLNGVKTDNNIMNLELMNHREFMRQSKIKDMSKRFCRLCKSKTTRPQKDKRYSLWYCGRKPGTFICENCYGKMKYWYGKNWTPKSTNNTLDHTP